MCSHEILGLLNFAFMPQMNHIRVRLEAGRDPPTNEIINTSPKNQATRAYAAEFVWTAQLNLGVTAT